MTKIKLIEQQWAKLIEEACEAMFERMRKGDTLQDTLCSAVRNLVKEGVPHGVIVRCLGERISESISELIKIHAEHGGR